MAPYTKAGEPAANQNLERVGRYSKSRTYQTQFKRDVLWKPLLRIFRRYLKRDALEKHQYQQIREQPIRAQGKLLSEALKLPENAVGKVRNRLAVLLLVNSHRVVFRKRLIPECHELMQSYADELLPLFFHIFQDNN